jgi:hypothetical protein
MAIKKKIENGGCAFPKPTVYAPGYSEIEYGGSGMTLRDYFAGQVMGHFVNTDTDHGALNKDSCKEPYFRKTLSVLARTAYAYADAMIAEKNKS